MSAEAPCPPEPPSPDGPRRRGRARLDLRRLGRAALLGSDGRGRLPDAIAHVAEAHRAHFPDADLEPLRRAYLLAESSHRGQVRKSGEPYITHPLAVTLILAELGAETTTLTAALLHDTVEDTEVTLEQVGASFGEEVRYLVDGVTKLEKVDYGAAAEPETFRKMLVATGNDVRVMSIKLADRLHNMRTLGVMRPDKQVRIAKVTRDVLIPLAERLGVQAVKAELEDLVFAILHPEEYRETRALIAAHAANGPDPLADIAREVRGVLREAGIGADVAIRPRHFFSVHRTRRRRGELRGADFGRLLILVAEDADCYAVLGELHTCFTPVIAEFKDYIAVPKFNLYQSLHTAVARPDGQMAQILIRTHRMHRTAEAGVIALGNPYAPAAPASAATTSGRPAAPGTASPGPADPARRSHPTPAPAVRDTVPASKPVTSGAVGPGGAPPSGASPAGPGRAQAAPGQEPVDGERADPTRPGWLSRLLAWQEAAPDPDTFWSTLRADLAQDREITVFRPDGGPLGLPAGASCVDAAYALYGEDAGACVGARVNGRMVTLGTVLADGDTVQLLMAQDPASGPSREWLDHAHTPAARIAIERWLATHPEPTAPGAAPATPDPDGAPAAAGAPGRGNRAGRMRRTGRTRQRATRAPGQHPAAANAVVDLPGATVRLAGCCTPVPPDRVTAFAVRGGVATVHRRECAAVARMKSAGREEVGVRWGESAECRVTLFAESFGRPRLLADLTEAIAVEGVAILSATVEPPSEQRVRHTYTLQLPHASCLPRLMRAMRRVPGVYDVSRAQRRTAAAW